MAHEGNKLTASPTTINVIRLNPDLIFSDAQIRALNAGTLVAVGPGRGFSPGGSGPLRDFGCIETLRYGNGDTDLVRVEFDSGEVLTKFGNCVNLDDFRARLQEAANFGHGLNGCLDTATKKLSMLNISPCECTCDERKQPNVTFPGNLTTSIAAQP